MLLKITYLTVTQAILFSTYFPVHQHTLKKEFVVNGSVLYLIKRVSFVAVLFSGCKGD